MYFIFNIAEKNTFLFLTTEMKIKKSQHLSKIHWFFTLSKQHLQYTFIYNMIKTT